ncbi:MAG TPA: creatininase family protein [Bryobacteraceae bacterium]|nr:creatininase family protein [Bryobacteraceae bacterium]
MSTRRILTILAALLVAAVLQAQTNPLWHEEKIKNYLPHMTWPEVQDLLTRTDMVIIPVASLEEHGPQTPIGTDFLSGVETAKLIAQKTDVLVAPVLLPGISPYHMEFPGTITISHDTAQRVYFEAVQSLIHHGFRRILFLNAHTGNQYLTAYVADRINQETAAIAVELHTVTQGAPAASPAVRTTSSAAPFDRHAGVGETSSAMFLIPTLVDLSKAGKNDLTLPEHLNRVLPQVNSGDRVASQVFLAEALKPKDTGKHTSTREMSATGVWSERDTRDATADRGRAATNSFVNAAVAFIEKWKVIRPLAPLTERQQR